MSTPSDRPKPSRLRISSPCPIDWEAQGLGDRGGFCDHCRKTVHDVEAMSEAEVQALVDSRESACIRLVHSPTGEVVTRDHPLSRRATVAASAALAASAIACSDVPAALGRTEPTVGAVVSVSVAPDEPKRDPTDHVLRTERLPVLRSLRGRMAAEVPVTSIGEVVLDSPPVGPVSTTLPLDLSPTVEILEWETTTTAGEMELEPLSIDSFEPCDED